MIQYILFIPGYPVHPGWGLCKARACKTLLFSVGKATQSWGRLSSARRLSLAGDKHGRWPGDSFPPVPHGEQVL